MGIASPKMNCWEDAIDLRKGHMDKTQRWASSYLYIDGASIYHLSIYLYSIYPSIHPSIHPSISLSLSLSLSLYLSIYLSIHPSIHPSIDQWIDRSIQDCSSDHPTLGQTCSEIKRLSNCSHEVIACKGLQQNTAGLLTNQGQQTEFKHV